MSVLNHIAQVAAVILLIEVIVVVLLMGGIFGGLAFGLRWVRGKVGLVSRHANHYLALGRSWLDKGLNAAALPVIKGAAWSDQLGATVAGVRTRVRDLQLRRQAVPAAGPAIMAAEATEEPDILV
ncbi:MAG TPA: hypothetical protein VF898_06000 [Chloroflexota bacterium]